MGSKYAKTPSTAKEKPAVSTKPDQSRPAAKPVAAAQDATLTAAEELGTGNLDVFV